MDEQGHWQRAMELALEAEAAGNLPIGAVITLDGQIVAEGKNTIWVPSFNANRHAEIEALRQVPEALWPRATEMTCYSTLEPCLMCLGALLLHRIGRIVYATADTFGGATPAIGHLPPFFEERLATTEWQGPAGLAACDDLYRRIQALIDVPHRPSGPLAGK